MFTVLVTPLWLEEEHSGPAMAPVDVGIGETDEAWSWLVGGNGKMSDEPRREGAWGVAGWCSPT